MGFGPRRRVPCAIDRGHVTPSLQGRAGEYFDPDWRNYLPQSARENLDAMQKSAGTNADVAISDSNNIPLAVSSTSQLEADLIVIGRAASGGMLGQLRTNAYSISRQSPCPVVSV